MKQLCAYQAQKSDEIIPFSVSVVMFFVNYLIYPRTNEKTQKIETRLKVVKGNLGSLFAQPVVLILLDLAIGYTVSIIKKHALVQRSITVDNRFYIISSNLSLLSCFSLPLPTD